MRTLILTIAFLLITSTAWATMDVELGWDTPECNPDIVKGYEVCYGPESGQYDTCEFIEGYLIDRHTVTGLTDGVMQYFAARTVGWSGLKSGFSNEVRTDGYTLPGGGVAPPAPGDCFIRGIK